METYRHFTRGDIITIKPRASTPELWEAYRGNEWVWAADYKPNLIRKLERGGYRRPCPKCGSAQHLQGTANGRTIVQCCDCGACVSDTAI